jgi:hypothetical protein
VNSFENFQDMKCKILDVGPDTSPNRLSFPYVTDAFLHMDYNCPDILDLLQAPTNLFKGWRIIWSKHDADGVQSLVDNGQIHTRSEEQLAELLLALWSAC